MNIEYIDSYRASLTIFDIDNNIYIIPLSVFIDIAKGKKDINSIEDIEKIIPTIISEWLYSVGINTGQIHD